MRISKEKQDRIKENILGLLFQNSPKALFTADIARELARDEEFIKKLLFQLKQQGFVADVQKNSKGKLYQRRIRWMLSPKVYAVYKKLHAKGIEVY
jgi:predicted transcriptional regulator